MKLRLKGDTGPICNKISEMYAKGGPGNTGTKHPIIPIMINITPITINTTSINQRYLFIR